MFKSYGTGSTTKDETSERRLYGMYTVFSLIMVSWNSKLVCFWKPYLKHFLNKIKQHNLSHFLSDKGFKGTM